MDGVILVNKEENYTSRDVVNIINGIFKTNKTGHTGTLDPMATGVLVICLGKATKLVELLTSNDKEYIAEIIFGIKTDTFDITGNILEEKKVHISKEVVIEKLQSMIGIYDQEVPIYSAIKVKGKKLYEYARLNEKVTVPKKKVEIKNLELLNIEYKNDKTVITIKCSVSKGTYIRSIANDLASELNTIGCMSKLQRIKQGNFKLEDTYTLDQIKNNNYKIINILEILKDYYTVNLDDQTYFRVKNGQTLNNTYKQELVLFVKNEEPIALYKNDNNKLKMYKMF